MLIRQSASICVGISRFISCYRWVFHLPDLSVSAVLSLDCFKCSSDESFESCDIKRTKETCQARTKCAKLSFHLSVGHRFRKGCLSVIYCADPDRYCQSIVGATDCQIYCCKKDVCNAIAPTTSHNVNWDLLLWCALAVKIITFH